MCVLLFWLGRCCFGGCDADAFCSAILLQVKKMPVRGPYVYGNLPQNHEEWFQLVHEEVLRMTPPMRAEGLTSERYVGQKEAPKKRPASPSTTTSSKPSEFSGSSRSSSSSKPSKSRKKQRSATKEFCISILKLVPGLIIEIILEKMHIIKPKP